jgi:hypothetical protein
MKGFMSASNPLSQETVIALNREITAMLSLASFQSITARRL